MYFVSFRMLPMFTLLFPSVILRACDFLQLQRRCLCKTIPSPFLSSWSERLNSVSFIQFFSAQRRPPENISSAMQYQGVFTTHFSVKFLDAVWRSKSLRGPSLRAK